MKKVEKRCLQKLLETLRYAHYRSTTDYVFYKITGRSTQLKRDILYVAQVAHLPLRLRRVKKTELFQLVFCGKAKATLSENKRIGVQSLIFISKEID